MTEEQEKPNTFAQMEQNKPAPKADQQKNSEPMKQNGEINVQDFSDTAVGDKVKYVRPALHGKEDVIEKFQVFMPDTTEEPEDSKNKTSKYWPVSMILTYESKNVDGVNNKEYISGCRCFVNRDGGASDPNFWYETNKKSQCVFLWETVAKKIGVEPKELSPRQFISFLNSKPKVMIVGTKYDNYNAPKGAPATITKNMPEFI